MWGYFDGDRLASMCHVGANLVPVNASPEACEAFVDRASRNGPRSSTIVGPQRRRSRCSGPGSRSTGHARATSGGTSRTSWRRRSRRCRATRWCGVRPRTRRTSSTRPAWRCTPRRSASAPSMDGGRDLYRARVNQLVGRGWSFSRIEDGRVVFKAEVACATPSACQIQGVYVDPELRGQGLATAGMATVVEICLREIAPVVSLYVNGHNDAGPGGLPSSRIRADRHLRHDHVLTESMSEPAHLSGLPLRRSRSSSAPSWRPAPCTWCARRPSSR